jgi:imidazolonepropionase-like amidohydrolase
MRLLHLSLSFLLLQTTPAQLLIKNTNVIDVEQKKILPGYSVLVVDGKIVQVDKDKAFKQLPAGTTVLDGSGKFLAPGFTDAHVHFFQSGGLYARPDAIDLRKSGPMRMK